LVVDLVYTGRSDGITLNCVAPGRINMTQVLNRLFPTEETRRREIELNVPAGRFGEPEEIAAVIRFSGELHHRHDDPGRWWIDAARSEVG